MSAHAAAFQNARRLDEDVDAHDFLLSFLCRSDIWATKAVCKSWQASSRRTLRSSEWNRDHATLAVCRSTSNADAMSNHVLLHPDDAAINGSETLYLRIGTHVLSARASFSVPAGSIALSALHRRLLHVSLG